MPTWHNIVAEGDRRKMNNRLKELRTATKRGRVSGRGGKLYAVQYRLEEIQK